MRGIRISVVAFALVAGSVAGTAWGGVLATDANGYTDGDGNWYGTRVFDMSNGYPYGAPWETQVLVDYCVYLPGQFALTHGFDPDPTRKVYAYQAFVTSPLYDGVMTRLAVDFDSDEDVGSIGYIAGSGSEDPSSYAFTPSTAGWNFNASGEGWLTDGESSSIVYFTSLGLPEWDDGSVSGTILDSKLLPSPAPEPSVTALLAIGGLCALIRGRRRCRP